MNRVRLHWLAVVVAGVHLALSVAGEALHLLPGLGHFEETPCGVCLWVGGDDKDHCQTTLVEPGSAWRARGGETGDILDAEECPVCHLVSLASERASATSWLPSLFILGHVSHLEPPCVASLRVALYGARAPPALRCI